MSQQQTPPLSKIESFLLGHDWDNAREKLRDYNGGKRKTIKLICFCPDLPDDILEMLAPRLLDKDKYCCWTSTWFQQASLNWSGSYMARFLEVVVRATRSPISFRRFPVSQYPLCNAGPGVFDVRSIECLRSREDLQDVLS